MITNKFKSGFLSASLLLILASCSKDDSTVANNNEQTGVLSNDELTLTYGASLLKQNVETNNMLIAFDRISGFSARSVNTIPSYVQENLSNAIDITAPGFNGSINNVGIYHIPAGKVYSSGLNFNAAATLVVDGTFNSNTNIPNGATIIFSPTGVTGNNSHFMLNSGSTLKNWGVINYVKGTVDGTIENNKEITFTDNVTINSSSNITNNCKMVFQKKLKIDKSLKNNSFVTIANGLEINSSGSLNIVPGSYTIIQSGQISLNGVIENSNTSNFARLDINAAVTKGNINGNNRITGKIDINKTTIPFDQLRVSNEVLANGDTYVEGSQCITTSAGTPPAPTCNDDLLKFTNVANVLSPTVGASKLSATDVKIVNGFAYVSYHTNDQTFGDAPNGSLRVFNIQSQNAPSLIAEAIFNNAEFNGVDVNDNKLYAVGGNKAGARMFTANLKQGTFEPNLESFSPYKLPSVSAKNSFVQGDNVWVVSGNTNGGLFTLNASNNYISAKVQEKEGAKYVAQNGTKQAFFAANNTGAYLRIASIDGSGAVEYTYPNLIQNVKDGKNVITMDDKYVYVALSDKGVAKFSLQDGTMKDHFEPNQYRVAGNKIFKKNGLTNGVAVNDCYLFLANGADGVIVLNKETFNVIGSFNLKESANFVYAKDGILFVATGRDGLNIVKIN